MALPGWLMALGSMAGGFQNQQQQQQRQQMIQALLQRRAQQNPGGIGAMGPQSWGANNTSQGGVIRDQWGNPIGPAGAPADGGGGSPTAAPPVAQATDLSQSASAAPPMPTNTYAPMAAAQPVPFMGGPSQAAPSGGVPGVSGQPGGFQAPQSSMDDAIMQALFAPQGA